MELIDQTVFEKSILSNSLVGSLFVSKEVAQCDQIADLVNDLIKQDEYKKIKFFSVELGNSTSLAKQFSVDSVPTLILFRNGNEVDRVVGADTAQIVQKLKKLLESNNSMEQRLVSLINQEPVMVFIKGNPQQPRCGFTRTLITLFSELKVKYGYFDILSDDEVRQSLKSYSNWPTYPQLYVKGNLIGGLDIIQDLHESGELVSLLSG